MVKRFRFLFFVVAAVEIVSQVFALDKIHLLTKPLLLIALLFYYFKATASLNKIFITALLFCWMGDVLLMFDHQEELFFIAGLASFMIAHILLIFSYRQFVFVDDGQNGPTRARLSFPVILASSGLVVILYPHLGDLKIPVVVYALILNLMVLQSIFRLGRTSANSFWLIFGGAVFFMLSDSLLAINKFYKPVSYAGVWIITTYIIAVFMIVSGAVNHSKIQKDG